MNSLSWFVYLADSIPNLSSVGVGLIILAGVLAFAMPPKGVEAFSKDHIPFSGFLAKTPYCVLILGLLLSIFTPSKETIYLIAGSEAGEMVIKTPEAQELMNDIHMVIKNQLEGLK